MAVTSRRTSKDKQSDASSDGRGAGNDKITGLLMMAAIVSAISGLLYGYDPESSPVRSCRSVRSSTPVAAWNR